VAVSTVDSIAKAPRWRRYRLVLGCAVAALVVAAGTVAAIGVGGGSQQAAPPTGLPPATTTVTKGTLTQTVQVSGTLSYGNPGLTGLIATTDHGIVTWLPAQGTTVKIGQPAYQVDGVPVVLVHGTVPPYRTLEPGTSGADVTELRATLTALGYHGVSGNGGYDDATADAVRQWQHDQGLAETGTVRPDQIVVAAGDIRVGLYGLQVGAELGGETNQTVYTYSGTTRNVTIALPVDQQQLVAKGTTATVTLPGGTAVKGTVTAVGTVASTEITTGSGAAPAPSKDPTLTVTVGIADQHALGTLTAAPVTVHLVSAQHTGVLTVPVTALRALTEGGYGVQVVSAGHSHLVAVKTGMFANGRVEISGAGITAGTTVGVPTT
jgi:hypothetical protein